MKLLLIAIIGFVLVGSISTVDGVYSACHQEVDNDDTLTFAEIQIQKQMCNTYNNRSGPSSVCLDEFRFDLKTTEKSGMYENQVVDLGTKIQIDGAGACNSSIILKLEKNGSIIDQSTTHSFMTGEFSKQYHFSELNDIGKYTLTAIRESTGEKHVLNFFVRSMEYTLESTAYNLENIKEKLGIFEQRLSYLESELENKNQIIMEQIKMISKLANMLTNNS